MKRKQITYTTPPGELLTATPAHDCQIINGSTVAEFFTTAGIAADVVNVCAAPQVVRYDLRLKDIYTYNESRINRALKAFQARFNTVSTLDRSSYGDFAIIATRTERQPLNLKSVIYTASFNDAPRTACAAGIDSNNNPVIIDIAKAPHILIAGTTGSGKSVLLNTMIVSLLYKATPATAQFIMIDPKQVEMTAYKDLPHLYKPIVTSAADAVLTLADACAEMDRRYKTLAASGYKQLADAPRLFPRLYIVIDELADLMLTSKNAVETSIVRIAQLGRAAGIHLIIATQRPTTNIITGLIKANIPLKIALAVSNTADSMTILNHGGAEKLTGRGDAIIKTPDSITERRLQAAFTPDGDIKNIVEYYSHSNPKRRRNPFTSLFHRTPTA